MSTSIHDLLVRAESAPPPEKKAKSLWACFYPVVSTLIRNGRNLFQAIEWLVQEKAIQPEDSRNAYRALLALHKRRNKK